MCMLFLLHVFVLSTSINATNYIVQLSDARDRSRLMGLSTAEMTIAPISQLILRDNLIGKERWEKFVFITVHDSVNASPTNRSFSHYDIAAVFPGIAFESVEREEDLVFFAEQFVSSPSPSSDSLTPQQWYFQNTGQFYTGIQRFTGANNDQQVLKQGLSGVDVGMENTIQNPPQEHTRVVVGIIDSGTDLFHPELQGQHWRNPDEIPGNNRDDDRNGFIDDTLGYDVSGDIRTFFNPIGDNNPTDSVGHGTHIAGIIGAKEDGKGIVGVSPDARIMTVKIRPNATTAVGAAGIMYAVNEGAQVLNLSWGTPYDSPLLLEVVRIARDNGVVVCVAMGNSGDASRFYPGAYSEVLTIGALNSTGHTTSFSTFGAPLDLLAPGEDILSLRASGSDLYVAADEPGVHIVDADSLYYLADGTSMACPMVVGAVARMWSVAPDKTAEDIISALRSSAKDVIDPMDDDSFLPGYDTLSGHGFLNIDSAISLVTSGGIFLLAPANQSRSEDAIPFILGRTGTYGGGFRLEIENPPYSRSFVTLASATSLPSDSLLHTISSGSSYSGERQIRLVADNGRMHTIRIHIAHQRRCEITSPDENQNFEYFVPISGSFLGPGFDSLTIQAIAVNTLIRTSITKGSAEFYDTNVATWELSGLTPGSYDIVANSWFSSELLSDTVRVMVSSAFATGWPVKYQASAVMSPVVSDLENDGTPELVLGTSDGVFAYTFDGRVKPGWPVYSDEDCRSLPAIYDLDRDGKREVIFTTNSGLRAARSDGREVTNAFSGLVRPFELFGKTSYGLPQVTVGEMTNSSDSALLILNTTGNIHAYELDGFPYFYSLNGRHSSMGEFGSNSYIYAGNSVASADLDGDGHNEVIASFSGQEPLAGVAVFDARTGEPYQDRASPIVQSMGIIYGTILADITGDALPEIIVVGSNGASTRTIIALTKGTQVVGGFPKLLTQLPGWRGSWPTVADLDMDGTPEILATFFEFDVGALYIFNHDGSPYRQLEGAPDGEALRLFTTFGPPVVANVTGNGRPEILFRTGYIFPNTGPERLQLYNSDIQPIPGWPVRTPSPISRVFSTIYTPLADDLDGDGLMEVALIGEGGDIFVWDMDARTPQIRSGGRLFQDELNSGKYVAPDISTEVDEPESLPDSFELRQNYPNPFNPTTTIVYDLPKTATVRLEILNVLGQTVTRLVDQTQTAGRYTIRFDGTDVASGVYFSRLTVGEQSISRKMVLQK